MLGDGWHRRCVINKCTGRAGQDWSIWKLFEVDKSSHPPPSLLKLESLKDFLRPWTLPFAGKVALCAGQGGTAADGAAEFEVLGLQQLRDGVPRCGFLFLDDF